METTRRGLFRGLAAAFAAAVVASPIELADSVLVAADRWLPRETTVKTIWGDVTFLVHEGGFVAQEYEAMERYIFAQLNTEPLRNEWVPSEEGGDWRTVPVTPVRVAITESFARTLVADASSG